MPGSYPNPNIGATLRNIVQRLRALETQQQSVISNPQGQPVYQTGTIVNSTGLVGYGIQWLNPATGVPVMFIGTDTNGIPALKVFSPNGTEEVRLGELSTSPALYGLAVLPYGGSQLQQVGGVVGVWDLSAVGVSNTSYVAFPGSTVAFEIGPSETFLMTISGLIQFGAGSIWGEIAWQLDSGAVGESVYFENDAPGNSSAYVSSTILEGASAGTHTATLYYLTSGAAVTFGGVGITIQPL